MADIGDGKTVTVGKSGIPKKLETSLPQPSTPPQLPQVAPSSSSSSSSTITAITCGDQAENVNVFAEYSGPKLFVKPATKSNRHLITNAITHCVLAGHVNKDMKDRVLQEIAKADAHHFLILFRNSGLQFRSLYSYLPESEEIIKIYGTGPRQVSSDMVEKIFKYNSGGKHFVAIPSKTMSVSVDAFVIYNHLWQHKKTGVAKRPQHPH
ncbi:calmodulin-regulated spectrin-associated protein 1-like [Saccoglossus kowalevskii]